MAAPKNEPIIYTAFILDFETGDLQPQTGACTQIAIHAIRLDTFERIDRYVAYIKPYNQKPGLGKPKKKVLKSKFDQEEEIPMLYEEKALTYSAITMDMLESMGKPIETVAVEVIDFFKRNTLNTKKNGKPFLIGQHIGFDIGFLQQMMEYGGQTKEFAKVLAGDVDFYGNFQPTYIDTIIMGKLALCQLPDMNSYKLEILAERLGIELDDAHDADADVAATANVAAVLTKRMRNASGSANDGIVMNNAEKTRKHFKF